MDGPTNVFSQAHFILTLVLECFQYAQFFNTSWQSPQWRRALTIQTIPRGVLHRQYNVTESASREGGVDDGQHMLKT